ncbi:MAG TPA: 3-phosphoshikimate 1-carboxyvinyltransferase, partial [Erysipelotrichaceae bacterium]|nr:3-phosphoshikimate 1-carboxyvinyltransferase [Erysipelotrichaceae bacterium]
MIVSIEPSKVAGSVQVPSSKSMGHRALICAGLANGMSTVSGITWSLDMEATIGCLKGLGATIERVDDQEENGLDERSFCITGCDPSKTGKGIVLDAYESGSTLRFMIPIAASGNEKVTFTGRGRLMERPMSVYEDLLGLEHINDTFVVQGPLRPGSYTMAGNVSSQFISGLLFALP